MIENGFSYVAVLVCLAAAMTALQQFTHQRKILTFVPAIVLVYVVAAMMNTAGLFANNAEISGAYSSVRGALLPAMLVLMLLKCDVRSIIKLGPRMLLAFSCAVVSIFVAFVVVYMALQGFFIDGTWRAFGALAGSWTGGSANMVALQDILQVPENLFGYILMMDTINYAVWVMFMFWLIPFAPKFNKWTKAPDVLGDSAAKLELEEEKEKPITFHNILYLLAIGLSVSAVCLWLGRILPVVGDVINGMTWTIMIASFIGLILAVTPVSRISGSMEISNVMLYVIIALIASRSDFSSLTQAPIYLVAGFLILLIHLVVMVLLGKIFRYDLFTLGVASLANIGGMASAPMLAASYHKSLIPIGILMALMGSFLGTYFGLLIGQLLSMI
ncbi:DUF819 family protein [Wohlfahrtiimonas populi]|uniref:DUF819 family protein n=1 Tax=Wohlfahrtiimonas populi TaxID=1940240 RepID=UPI00098D46A9|nr:DUF819 family protein [Wohlfahrtiimonas populi]